MWQCSEVLVEYIAIVASTLVPMRRGRGIGIAFSVALELLTHTNYFKAFSYFLCDTVIQENADNRLEVTKDNSVPN